MARRDLRRRDAAQIEQGRAERRVHVGGLQVHRHHDAEPDRIDARQRQQRGRDDRHHHEDDLEGVHHEAEQEHREHHDQDRARGAARQVAQMAMDQIVAVEPAEHEAEQGRADQDDEDHAVICAVFSTTGRSTGRKPPDL